MSPDSAIPSIQVALPGIFYALTLPCRSLPFPSLSKCEIYLYICIDKGEGRCNMLYISVLHTLLFDTDYDTD